MPKHWAASLNNCRHRNASRGRREQKIIPRRHKCPARHGTQHNVNNSATCSRPSEESLPASRRCRKNAPNTKNMSTRRRALPLNMSGDQQARTLKRSARMERKYIHHRTNHTPRAGCVDPSPGSPDRWEGGMEGINTSTARFKGYVRRRRKGFALGRQDVRSGDRSDMRTNLGDRRSTSDRNSCVELFPFGEAVSRRSWRCLAEVAPDL